MRAAVAQTRMSTLALQQQETKTSVHMDDKNRERVKDPLHVLKHTFSSCECV